MPWLTISQKISASTNDLLLFSTAKDTFNSHHNPEKLEPEKGKQWNYYYVLEILPCIYLSNQPVMVAMRDYLGIPYFQKISIFTNIRNIKVQK